MSGYPAEAGKSEAEEFNQPKKDVPKTQAKPPTQASTWSMTRLVEGTAVYGRGWEESLLTTSEWTVFPRR